MATTTSRSASSLSLNVKVLGSDFPFGMGDDDPVGLVDKARLSEADREKITFGNASRLFKISKVGAQASIGAKQTSF